MKKSQKLKYKDIKVGKKVSFKRRISQKDAETFACLSGDFNPLHLDKKFADKTIFKGTVVHGMLAASLFSCSIGMHCPGENALILSQEIKYIRPIRPGSDVRVLCEVARKIDSVKVLVIKGYIYAKDGSLLIEGVNKVKVTR